MNVSLPFTLRGRTVPGKRLGTELGFPTANLDYPPVEGLPSNGVYAARATVDGQSYVAVLNQGHHPTAPGGNPTIETHLLGYAGGDLYGRELTLTYLHYLRPERHFETLAALKVQLGADAEAALRWTREHGTAAD